MATNGVNTSEDAEMSLCEGDSVVTMMDVLKEQQDFEDDANAVLGASDDKNCTYSKGYVKRQAIYACLTCCPEAKADPSKRAGVCLACSLNCHENHELIELYTKRNFRCDCGNPKFNSHPCQFTPNKNDLNYENKYNQNFSGIYCVCHRPYPDPEAVEEEEMLQCIVCEDWLHTKHLEATVPHNDLYEEMICKDCMEDNDFLHDYSDLVVNVVDKEVVVDEFDFDFEMKKSPRKGKSKKSVANGKVDVKSDKLDDKAETLLTNGEKKNEETTSEKIDDKVNFENLSNEKNDSKIDTSSSEIETKDVEKTDQSEVSADKLTKNETNDLKDDTSLNEVENKDIEKPDQSDISADKLNETNDSKADASSNELNKDTDKTGQSNAEDLKPEETMNGEPQQGEKAESIISEENKTDSIETKENTEQNKKPETAEEQKENEIKDQEKMEEDRLLQDDAEIPVTKHDTENAELSDAKKNEDETENEIHDPAPTETKKNDAMETENNDTPQKKEDDATEANPDTTKTDEASEAAPNTLENSENKRKLNEQTDDELVAKKPKLDCKPCIRPKGVKRVYKGATFWPANLRQKLCTCNECIAMYKDLAVLFLIDPEDTVNAYEALGKEISEGPSSQYEKGLQALSSLDRVQQINAMTEYNKMRDKLLDFLKGYKERKEIVKEEDIKSFFAGMKPKREPDGVYFCR